MRASCKLFARLLPGLVTVVLGAGCHRGSEAARTTVAAGQAIGLVKGSGSAAGTAVALPADALPAGATVKIFSGRIDAPDGFAPAGPAARIDFSAALAAGQDAVVTLPFDPCLLDAQSAAPGDIVVLVVEYGGSRSTMSPLVVDAGDETVEFAVTTSVTVMAVVPAGRRAPIPPFAGLSTHGIVVDEDNAVWTWGLNYAGQLAEGTRSITNLPRLVPGLTDVVSVEAGDGFSVVLLADGTVKAWGANFAGQLGPRTDSKLDHPAPILGIGCIDRIAVGPNAGTVLALGRNGMLYSWGENIDGQAGQGSPARAALPAAVLDVTRPRDFDVSSHGLAALDTGEVMAWGQNFRGQLGTGTFANTNLPVLVTGLEGEDIVTVAAGGQFSLALSRMGEVWAWGANESGQVGDGTFVDRAEPRLVPGVRNVVAIAASARTALALDVFGDVWTWGAGESGQRGDGTFDATGPVPFRVGGFTDPVVDVDGGANGFLVVLADGRVFAWGRNDVGQVGDGSFFDRSVPTEIGRR